jgi:hypothetical protein
MIDHILELDLSADRAKLRPTTKMGQRRDNALAPDTEASSMSKTKATHDPTKRRPTRYRGITSRVKADGSKTPQLPLANTLTWRRVLPGAAVVAQSDRRCHARQTAR